MKMGFLGEVILANDKEGMQIKANGRNYKSARNSRRKRKENEHM